MRTLLTIPCLLLLTAACVGGPGEVPADYSAMLPDDRLLINLPADEAGRRNGYSEAYLFTAQATRDVNGLIAVILGSVNLLVTTYPPTWHDTESNTAVWGPWADGLDPHETVLLVSEDDTGLHSWVIARRPRGEESWDAFTEIVVGQVEPGATQEASEGWFYMDFDAIAATDPLATAGGRFATLYEIRADGVAATAGFEQFTDNDSEPIDAWYDYDQRHGGGGRMDLAWYGDVNPGQGAGLQEGHVVRSRWLATGAGRADMVVGGGDLEALGLVGTASECWGETFSRDFYENNWNTSETEGDAALCVFEAAEWPEEEDGV